MRKRDLGILVLSAFAIYYQMRQEGNFSFRKGWVHSLEAEGGALVDDDRLPSPISADLNGDGKMEVLVATRDAKLQVLAPPSKVTGSSQEFSTAQVVGEVSLMPSMVRIGVGRNAVAMAVGYLDHSNYVLTENRKQVIVVVTSAWNVMCFDHNLSLLWEKSIQDDFPHKASIREVAIVITENGYYSDDRGMIVVGGSIDLGDLLNNPDPFDDLDFDEEMANLHHMSAGRRDRMHAAEGLGKGQARFDRTRHFSYYAFEGGAGAERWRHESKDFHRDTSALKDTLVPQHNYRLDAHSLNTRHFGEVECREYKRSVLAELPHRWSRREDTTLSLAHFVKHRPSRDKDKKDKKSKAASGKDAGNQVLSTVGAAVDAATSAKRVAGPHRDPHKDQPPNVLVAHLQEGLEVVHLYGGRTLCKLLLPAPGLHADINGDGVVDHVQAYGATHHLETTSDNQVPRCWATAYTGLPADHQLFNGTICRSPVANLDSSKMSRRSTSEEAFSTLEVAVPVLLQRSAKRAAWAGGKSGRHVGIQDVVFLNSRGELTVYSGDGVKRWQIQAHAKWQRGGYDGHHDVAPTLTVMHPRVKGRAQVVLAAGASIAQFVSPLGKKMHKIDLPGVPIAPIEPVDLNGDGLTDLLVTVHGGVFAYIQHSSLGALPFSALLGCLMVAMAIVYFSLEGSGPTGKSQRSTD